MAYLTDGEWYVIREGDEMLLAHHGAGESVRMPLDLFDDVVLMRFAQIYAEHGGADRTELEKLIRRACGHGTLGAEALRAEIGIPKLFNPDEEAERAAKFRDEFRR